MKTRLVLALVLSAIADGAQASAPRPPLADEGKDQTLLEILRAKGLLTEEEYEVLVRRVQQAPSAGAPAERQLDEALARIEHERRRDDAMRPPTITLSHEPGAGFTLATE